MIMLGWLLALAAAAPSAADALPPAGWVDVDRLVAEHPARARVEALRRQAAELRRAVDTAPTPAPPALPEDTPLTVDSPVLTGANGFAERAEEIELSLLREALLDRLQHEGRTMLTDQTRGLEQDLLARRDADRAAQRRWERQLAEHQQLEVIELRLRLGEAATAALEAEALDRELNILAGLNAAVGSARAEAIDRSHTRRTRQMAAGLQGEIDGVARAQERRVDMELARRELELREAADRRREAGALGGATPPAMDLRLDEWRRILPEQGNRRAAERDAHAVSLRAAADRLEAEAATLDARLTVDLTWRLEAFCALLARREGIELRLEPAEGLPDVTDQVARRLAALDADPLLVLPAETAR